jgi:hypothetical protein
MEVLGERTISQSVVSRVIWDRVCKVPEQRGDRGCIILMLMDVCFVELLKSIVIETNTINMPVAAVKNISRRLNLATTNIANGTATIRF